jgi:hypothetical protein
LRLSTAGVIARLAGAGFTVTRHEAPAGMVALLATLAPRRS